MLQAIIRGDAGYPRARLRLLAQAQGCQNRLVVFGDSLTDPGNFYAATGTTSKAPFSPH
jgi:hypothetical protein